MEILEHVRDTEQSLLPIGGVTGTLVQQMVSEKK